MVYMNHPRSFLLDEGAKYLEKLGLSSATSYQYKALKKNVNKYLTCCVTSPLKSIGEL